MCIVNPGLAKPNATSQQNHIRFSVAVNMCVPESSLTHGCLSTIPALALTRRYPQTSVFGSLYTLGGGI